MKNKYLSTRILAVVMAATMAVSAAPAAFAAERADSETINEDNQPAADTEENTDAEEADAEETDTEETTDAEATKTEYPLTITTYDYEGNEIEGINSELQGLRARLYDRFYPNWQNMATENLRREISSLKLYKPKYERRIKKYEEEIRNCPRLEYTTGIGEALIRERNKLNETEAKIKALEEEINKIKQYDLMEVML